MKRNFRNGQFVYVAGVIEGMYSYPTQFGGSNTVPKVYIYAIRSAFNGYY